MDYDERRRSDKYRPSSRHDDRDYHQSHHSEHDDRYVSKHKQRSKSRSRSRSPSQQQQYTPSYNRNTTGGPSHKNFGNAGYRQNRDVSVGSNSQPSRTIMLRNLPFSMDDIELKHELSSLSVPYKDVRLVKTRDTEMNRGFAFVEFPSLDDSQRWMNQTQGWVLFSNSHNRIQLCYSHSEDSQRNETSNAAEWDCSKCGVRNFKKRDRCFKCGISKEESEIRKGGDGYDQVGSTPCNTIILRGLDALTNKDTIVETVQAKTNHIVVVKNCEVSRDPFTSVSNGFAFVELNSIADAGYMLQLLTPAFEIDGKLVSVNYSKNSFKTAISQTEMRSVNFYSAAMESSRDRRSDQVVISNANQTDRTNSAAALAQAAMKNMAKKQVAASHYANAYKGVETGSDLAAAVAAAATSAYSTPDVSKFVYDDQSGYYYDYSTGFYYDATSQYYYNPVAQQYMYWDPTTSTYIPVTSTASTDQSVTNATSSAESDSKQTEKQPVQAKVVNKQPAKTAAQIAKDMEKWAESMNKKKEATKKVPVTIPSTPTRSSEPAKSVESSFSAVSSSPFSSSFSSFVVDHSKPAPDQPSSSLKKLQVESEKPPTATAAAVTTMTRSNETSIDESSFIDVSKMACLLCKRKFDSIDILNKHVAKSDLHKTNLEKLKSEKRTNELRQTDDSSNSNSSEAVYSNNDTLSAALKFKERAEKELKVKMIEERKPSPPPPSRNSKSAKVKHGERDDEEIDYANQSNSQGSSDFATKMMKKFGWTEGSGIGKNLQGISAPIQATMHQKGSGLGSSSSHEIEPNESYHQGVKRSARSRFEQLMNR